MTLSANIAAKKTRTQKKVSSSDWLVPVGLIFLSLVPVIAGMVRLTELSSGAEITPDNARFFASPIPVVLHIISITVYSILGAFQFSGGLRRQKPRWHRAIGWFLVPSGFIAALSGLWMSQFYALPAMDGQILYVLRLIFGWGMLACLVLAVIAVRQRNFSQHGAWMIRAYAIALGAGTQVFTHLPWFLLSSELDESTRAIAMGAGWVINLVIAEWIIRKYVSRKTKLANK